jgi:hypothetical protein
MAIVFFLVMAGFGLLLAVIHFSRNADPVQEPFPVAPKSFVRNYSDLDVEDPAASFTTLRYVAETGGDPATRQQALIWLDERARTLMPLSPEQESWLLSLIENGGHQAWDIEYQLGFYNSAFNALHLSDNPAPLTRILLDLASKHPHRTMRLYALQHIGSQWATRRIPEAYAPEIRDFLHQQILLPDSEIAGSCLVILAAWDDSLFSSAVADHAPLGDIPKRACEIAADATRPVDVRVTALHAAAAQALELSRKLAGDTEQPMLLRKAAIACMGRYGDQNDITSLQSLSGQNPRLAQAADPALALISHRIAHKNSPTPVPF